MADTFEQLMSSVSAFKQGSDTATQQVIEALGAQQKLNAGVVQTYQTEATDDTTVAAAKNAADYQTQLSRVRAANMAGTNLKNTSEVLTSLSAAAADAQSRKDDALAAIADKDSVGFLDNPIQYLANQFTINSDIARHNIANAQLESAQNRIMAVNLATQTTIQTQNAITEPITAASMEASARNAAVAATVAAKQAEINGLSYGTKGIEFALNAKKETLALGFQALNAKTAQESQKIALAHLELSKKEFAQRQKEYEERDADKHDQQALGQSVIDTVNLGRTALLGAGTAPLDDINGKMILAALKGKGTLSTEMQKYYDAGERTRLAGTPIIGSTPAAAAATMQSVPVQLNPTQGPIKSLLAQAASDTSSAIKNVDLPGQNKNPVFAGIDRKDKNSVEAAYNGRAQQILNGYSSVVKPGDSDNPYQVASINQLAANSPTVAALPVVQKVFVPLMKAGVQLSDPKQIVSLVGEAVAKGTITHKEALELSTVYHVGVAANLAMRNFPGFGLIPSRSYNASIETDPSAFTSSEVVDLTKPDSLSRALMKIQSSRLRDQLMSGEKSMTPGVNRATDALGAKIDSLFQPQPEAARGLQMQVDKAGDAVDKFFNTGLPHASPAQQR